MLSFAIEDLRMRAAAVPSGQGAALHQRVPELAARLTDVRAGAGCRAQIRTQVGTSRGRFVDLEIRLRPDLVRRDRDLVFWVEVKHGAPVHGDQLEVYEVDAPANGLVMVVAPLQSMPVVPPRMPLVPWQRLGEVVRSRGRRAPAASSERFILNAYADYLKDEELMDDVLTPTHALALAHHASADRLLARLCQLADPEVQRRWATREEQHSPRGNVKYEQGWWATYPVQPREGAEPSPGWRSTWLEWGLSDDGGRHDEARNTTAFVAGASMEADNPVDVDENTGWVNDLRQNNFAVYKGHYQRVYAFLYPEQLLAETTLDGQARYLTDWVVETFARLTSTPPPH
jgi:hypothetical protein